MKSLDSDISKRILIIEDEPSITIICDRILTSRGFQVDIAANGKMAQSMVDKKRYSLCLIDIMIPEMNGIEFFRWLGDRHPEMSNRVIFTTGKMLCEETILFIEQSGTPLLPKPFTPNDLQSIVSNTINHNIKNNKIDTLIT